MEYKRLPIPKERLDEMVKNPIYADMLAKYGEQNLRDNYLVDFCILQEEKAIYTQSGDKIDVTKEMIRTVYNRTQSFFERFISAPINAFKSWVTEDPEHLGYVPMLLNHEEDMINKHGFMVGGSLRLANIQGKLHLLCKIVLVSPESKYNWLQGLWREVSPGLANYRIREVSFVTIPAQMGNSSMASGEPINDNQSTSTTVEELPDLLAKAKARYEQEKLSNLLKLSEHESITLTEQLIQAKVIPTASRKKMQVGFMALSSGERTDVAKLIYGSGAVSPLHRSKTRSVFIQGVPDVQSKQEAFKEFQAANQSSIPDAAELIAAFQKSYAQQEAAQLNLSSGEGKVVELTKDDKYNELLDLLEQDEAIDEKIKSRIKNFCNTKLADGAPGGTIDAGGVSQPNNANLGDGTPAITTEGQDEYVTTLEQANASLQAKFDEAQTKLFNISQQFGGK